MGYRAGNRKPKFDRHTQRGPGIAIHTWPGRDVHVYLDPNFFGPVDTDWLAYHFRELCEVKVSVGILPPPNPGFGALPPAPLRPSPTEAVRY